MRVRALSIIAVGTLAVFGASAWLIRSRGKEASSAFPVTWTGSDVCPPGGAATSEGSGGFLSFFTGGGSYMPRTHCIVTQEGGTDWPWVWILLTLSAIVIAGYAKIFVFWRRAYRDEHPGDRNKKLMDLAYIFMWCAICGYASAIVMFFWPGYRLVALCLAPLAFFTWKFAANLDDMRVSLSAKRLARELEESHRETTAELELAVHERTVELEKARAVAQKANDAKSAFVANISHEIRTPMTAILGFAEALENTAGTEQERQEMVATIRRNGDHLLMLINDVLDLSKIESGKMAVDLTACRPAQVVREVMDLLGERAIAKGLELELSVDQASEREILTDQTRLRQILLNIIANAIKFTSRGGVQVDMRRGEHAGQSVLECTIRDTGIGMSAQEQERVFEAFSQGNDSTTRQFGGTGLGLHISRHLARHLGGEIEVESQIGRGSTFRVVITAPDASNASESPALNAPIKGSVGILSCDGRAHRVLIVDDGADNRRLARFHLEKAGFEVEEAQDGARATAAVETGLGTDAQFDLVLMDLEMPLVDGFEATRRIKAMAPEIPIVALTAHAMEATVLACERAGCDEVLSKPYRAHELVSICTRWTTSGSSGADAA